MGKLFVVLIVLALIAAVFIVLAVLAAHASERALEARRERKGIEPPHDVDGDDLWLYAQGVSKEDIELARAQRRLLQ